MKFSYIILAIVILVIICFLKFGRSIYAPILTKIKGKETIVSITSKLEAKVLNRLKPDFEKLNLQNFPEDLMIVAYKEEQRLEVYVKINNSYQVLKTYPFTAFSGKIGPKLKEGDRQIPEGIYSIEYLNPNSAYYLSMKINYPNAFDISKSKFDTNSEMGSDIFIHGKAVTIGCIPIGDKGIEELFLLVQKAMHNSVKVIISPKDFRKDSNFPTIDEIEWEEELYQNIKDELEILID